MILAGDIYFTNNGRRLYMFQVNSGTVIPGTVVRFAFERQLLEGEPTMRTVKLFHKYVDKAVRVGIGAEGVDSRIVNLHQIYKRMIIV
jgi:hypothetical protein